MKVSRMFAAIALAVAALTGYAQEAPKPAAARQEPVVAAMSSAQCAAIRRARHDHGIERNTGPMSIKGCGPTNVAAADSKALPGHDHGKFHKNQ
jgi:hypothetical protein